MSTLKKIVVYPESQLIKKIVYRQDEQLMFVQYRTKGLLSRKAKRYDQVSYSNFEEIISSVSVGKALMRYLKRQKQEAA